MTIGFPLLLLKKLVVVGLFGSHLLIIFSLVLFFIILLESFALGLSFLYSYTSHYFDPFFDIGEPHCFNIVFYFLNILLFVLYMFNFHGFLQLNQHLF